MTTIKNTHTQVRREFSYTQCHMIHLRVSLSFYGGAIRVYVTKKAKGIKKAKNPKDTKKAKKEKRQKKAIKQKTIKKAKKDKKIKKAKKAKKTKKAKNNKTIKKDKIHKKRIKTIKDKRQKR